MLLLLCSVSSTAARNTGVLYFSSNYCFVMTDTLNRTKQPTYGGELLEKHMHHTGTHTNTDRRTRTWTLWVKHQFFTKVFCQQLRFLVSSSSSPSRRCCRCCRACHRLRHTERLHYGCCTWLFITIRSQLIGFKLGVLDSIPVRSFPILLVKSAHLSPELLPHREVVSIGPTFTS